MGYVLANRAGAVWRDGHEQHCDCGQTVVRAARDGVRARQARDGCVAVSRLGGGAAAGADTRAGFVARQAADGVGPSGPESGCVAGAAANRWAAGDALVADDCGAA